MRTGSNLLEKNLNQFDAIECHGELFNPSFIGKPNQASFLGIDKAKREADPQWLISKIVSHDDHKLSGFRIFLGHDNRIFESVIADPECAKIILRRTPLDSFISLKIAKETNQWMLGNAPKRKSATVRFDKGEYSAYLAELDGYHSNLRKHLQLAGQTAFEIRYEDLKSVDVLNGLAKFLGIKEEKTNFAEKIKRQNPESVQSLLNKILARVLIGAFHPEIW